MYQNERLNELRRRIFEQEMEPVPGWEKVEMSHLAQIERGVGKLGRMRPATNVHPIEVHLGPQEIDTKLRVPLVIMESLAPAVQTYVQGGKFLMPFNLQIVVPPVTAPVFGTQEQELYILKKKIDEHGELSLLNPNPGCLRVVASLQASTEIVCSLDYVPKYEEEAKPYRLRGHDVQVVSFSRHVMYTGSRGQKGKQGRWWGLQPSPYGPNVYGRQYHPWGISYQYSRKRRTYDLTFEYEPPFFRYSTLSVMDYSSDMFVVSSFPWKWKPVEGKGPVIGCVPTGDFRPSSSLGPLTKFGPYYIRLDGTKPIVQDKYHVSGTVISFGDCLTPVKGRPPPLSRESKCYNLSTHCYQQCFIQGTYIYMENMESVATFELRGAWSDACFFRNYGSVISPYQVHQVSSEETQYGLGSSIESHVQEVDLDSGPREVSTLQYRQARRLIESGRALVDRNLVVKVEGEVDVMGISRKFIEVLRGACVVPVQNVTLSDLHRGQMIASGFVLVKDRHGTYTVSFVRVPFREWAQDAWVSEPEEFRELPEL